MKVLALNSSPRSAGQSKTELMLDRLVKGMRDAGAEVEVVNLRERKVKDCIGCFACWSQIPGKCIHTDEMTLELFSKWRDSDVAVYATPLYSYGMAASLKRFMERTLPSFLPFFDMHDGRMYHPLRHKIPAAVMLAVAGMPDTQQFQTLSSHINYYCGSPGRKLLAEIYRSASEVMGLPFMQAEVDAVLAATEEAGRELVRSQKISPETMAAITQPIVENDFYIELANMMWNTCIAEKVTLKEFYEKNMVPRPASLEEFMLAFPVGLGSKAAGDRKIALQFIFSGEVAEPCYFNIEKSGISAHKGLCSQPDLTVETAFDLWMDIMTGKADGAQMFMEQKYTMSGDLDLIGQIFPM